MSVLVSDVNSLSVSHLHLSAARGIHWIPETRGCNATTYIYQCVHLHWIINTLICSRGLNHGFSFGWLKQIDNSHVFSRLHLPPAFDCSLLVVAHLTWVVVRGRRWLMADISWHIMGSSRRLPTLGSTRRAGLKGPHGRFACLSSLSANQMNFCFSRMPLSKLSKVHWFISYLSDRRCFRLVAEWYENICFLAVRPVTSGTQTEKKLILWKLSEVVNFKVDKEKNSVGVASHSADYYSYNCIHF